MKPARNNVIAFLVLAFVLSAPFYALIISAGTINVAGGLYVAAIMWCPGVAALLTRLLFQRNLRGVGWGWAQTRYQLLGYCIPIVACLFVYGFVWTTGIGAVSGERLTSGPADILGFVQSASVPLAVTVAGTIGFLELVIFVTGEELGWRGLLVPELVKLTGYTRAALITGIVWAVFHYPLLFFADYNSGAPLWYVSVCFTVGIIAGSFIVSWLRLQSGSVWTAVVMHSSHNLFTGVFDRLTVKEGWTDYITTEFGAGLALAYSIIAYWCWRQYAKLPQETARDASV